MVVEAFLEQGRVAWRRGVKVRRAKLHSLGGGWSRQGQLHWGRGTLVCDRMSREKATGE